jgi:hypothetical protein
MSNQSRSTLKKPKSYFVDLESYKIDNPGIVVQEKDKVWEQIDGEWIEGVIWSEC